MPKFIITYTQNVVVNCRDADMAKRLVEQDKPYISVTGAATDGGSYDYKSIEDSFSIINVKEVKNENTTN